MFLLVTRYASPPLLLPFPVSRLHSEQIEDVKIPREVVQIANGIKKTRIANENGITYAHPGSSITVVSPHERVQPLFTEAEYLDHGLLTSNSAQLLSLEKKYFLDHQYLAKTDPKNLVPPAAFFRIKIPQ